MNTHILFQNISGIMSLNSSSPAVPLIQAIGSLLGHCKSLTPSPPFLSCPSKIFNRATREALSNRKSRILMHQPKLSNSFPLCCGRSRSACKGSTQAPSTFLSAHISKHTAAHAVSAPLVPLLPALLSAPQNLFIGCSLCLGCSSRFRSKVTFSVSSDPTTVLHIQLFPIFSVPVTLLFFNPKAHEICRYTVQYL